jgi:hypothetical protein
VPADRTAGERLSVDVAPAVSDRWRVAVAEGGGLEVLPVTADDRPAAAILHTTAAELAEVLAGTAPAVVEGDARAVRTLLAWFDRVQRGAH